MLPFVEVADALSEQQNEFRRVSSTVDTIAAIVNLDLEALSLDKCYMIVTLDVR